MKFVKLTTAVTSDMSYCFAGSIRDAEACELYISDGDSVGSAYPSDPFSVKVLLDPDFAGVRLPSLIGNTRSLLMLHRDAVDAFESSLDLGEHEVFPFTLVNHKGRVHSQDYVFLNPVGSHDFAAPSSDFLRYPSGGIYGCRHWVLRAKQLEGLPDIVRAVEMPTDYFVSERLIALVGAKHLTNFEFVDVGLI